LVRRGHVPQRTCAGCGRRFDKESLVRFTILAEDGDRVVTLDADGRGIGRGAYMCASVDCLEMAMKRNELKRRLQASAVSRDVRREFMENIADAGNRNGEKKSPRDSKRK
jgi:predicted RNA-binding protein YlxR (DUF448 family)